MTKDDPILQLKQGPVAHRLATLQAKKQASIVTQRPIGVSSMAPRSKRTSYAWTGFAEKTLWDWLGLLIVPALLAVIAIWFNVQQSTVSNQLTAQQASEQQQGVILQSYFNSMTNLVQNGKITNIHSEIAIRALASAQTRAALLRLNAQGKGSLILFLFDARLINRPVPIIDLNGASMQGADLHDMNLTGANLRGTDLRNANLENTKLGAADLVNAELDNANLHNAEFGGADLSGARVRNADLRGINLYHADHYGTDFSGSSPLPFH